MSLAALKARREAGDTAVHGSFLRQPARQRPRHPRRDGGAGRAPRRGVAARRRGLPERHGQLHHAGDDQRRPRHGRRALRDRGRRPGLCEPFRQWVLEDDFPEGRPPLEEVGVEFVADVVPYELMKLRVLNAGHAAIAYSSAMLGHNLPTRRCRTRTWSPGSCRYLARGDPDPSPIAGVEFRHYLDPASGVWATRRWATPSHASASTARTGSRSSSCPPFATGCRRAPHRRPGAEIALARLLCGRRGSGRAGHRGRARRAAPRGDSGCTRAFQDRDSSATCAGRHASCRRHRGRVTDRGRGHPRGDQDLRRAIIGRIDVRTMHPAQP